MVSEFESTQMIGIVYGWFRQGRITKDPFLGAPRGRLVCVLVNPPLPAPHYCLPEGLQQIRFTFVILNYASIIEQQYERKGMGRKEGNGELTRAEGSGGAGRVIVEEVIEKMKAGIACSSVYCSEATMGSKQWGTRAKRTAGSIQERGGYTGREQHAFFENRCSSFCIVHIVHINLMSCGSYKASSSFSYLTQ